ncbi:hypothetical protein TWF225_006062 [Orbilia oligospora]|nr:hypothetical protein TWF225_006062 [Orbilia oligospora]KAF3276699.1 hypothetical protein TWF132_002126 [Orbilia oligospora]
MPNVYGISDYNRQNTRRLYIVQDSSFDWRVVLSDDLFRKVPYLRQTRSTSSPWTTLVRWYLIRCLDPEKQYIFGDNAVEKNEAKR